jgi:chemotaxis receptor (MCP) glutamine deamidase CheD
MTTASVRRLRPEVTLYIGDLRASAEPLLVKTLLGSCIAVCLWDPGTSTGGMNHFMLPRAFSGDGQESSRFGVHAMDLLIGAVMKAGGDRRRFVAKVFGGGHVLGLPDVEDSVPRQNIAFIRAFLLAERLPIAAEVVGGPEARHVHFETDTGRAWVKHIRSTQVREALARRERPAADRTAPAFGEVTLF